MHSCQCTRVCSRCGGHSASLVCIQLGETPFVDPPILRDLPGFPSRRCFHHMPMPVPCCSTGWNKCCFLPSYRWRGTRRFCIISGSAHLWRPFNSYRASTGPCRSQRVVRQSGQCPGSGPCLPDEHRNASRPGGQSIGECRSDKLKTNQLASWQSPTAGAAKPIAARTSGW